MHQLTKTQQAIQLVAFFLLIVGAALHIVHPLVSVVVFSVGVLPFAWTRLLQRYDGSDIVIARLRRQQLIGTALMVFTAPVMVLGRHNEWIVCLSIACVLEVYTSFRLK